MYRRSLFTFLDILGFRQIVGSKTPEEVHDILEILRQEAKPDETTAEMLEMDFLTFSDSTIRSIPIESKSNKKYPSGILWNEILQLVHLQYRMLRRGFLIRGGMTIEDIYIKDDMVFGPAIVQAYTLENEFAVYPRIVIDPAVMTSWENDPLLRYHDKDTEWEFMERVLRKDSDGLYFVDYLGGMRGEFDEDGMEFDFFDYHREYIIENAKNPKNPKYLNKIGAKYLWLATYHNTVIREIPDKAFEHFGIDRDDYLITNDDIPLLYERE